MRAVVVYESMFGNTRSVAEAVAEGLRQSAEVQVAPVGQATAAFLDGADLLVVGGPTHAHGMSRPATRRGAAQVAGRPGSGVDLQPGAEGAGLREWANGLGQITAVVAAFDTRGAAPGFVTGRASRGLERRLRRAGGRPLAAPTSFLVDSDNVLVDGELERARAWGERLGQLAAGRLAAAGAG